MESGSPITIDDSTALDSAAGGSDLSEHAAAQYRGDLASFGWWSIGDWTILAAGVYALLLSAVGLSVSCIKCLTYGFSSSPYTATDWLWMLLYIPVACVGCIFWVGMIAAVTLPILHLVVRSLELKISFARLGAFAGGFLVFIATLPISLDWPQMQRNFGWKEVARVMLMGPAVATIVGQIGGAYGGLRASRRAEDQREIRRRLVQLGWRQATSNSQSPDPGESSVNNNRPWLQFRTVHLLWAVAWISVVPTVIRLVGLRFETVLPVIFGWLLYQSLTLWLGGIAAGRLAPWWARRWQGRST